MIIAKVRDRDIKLTPLAPVTSGSVGLPVKWEFGEEWDGLQKTAVFKGSDEARDVWLRDDTCSVPLDVLKEYGGPLEIGVYGRLSNGTIVMPTVWGRIDFIRRGVELSEADPSEPEPDWAAQVQAVAQEALEKAEGVEEAAARGDFNGEDGFSPTVETERIDGTNGCIVIEDGAGNKWCFLPGPGSDGDVLIEDDDGNQWHMPAGEAESGEIAAQAEGGGAWHLPVGSDGSGYRITITDKDGEHVAYVWDGERGADGRQGVDGQPGQEGFSPLVNMTEITGGYRLTITDKTGAHSVNIYNGEESIIFVATYGTTTQEELDAAYSAGKLLFAHHDLDYLPLSKASYIEVSGERRWMYAFSGYSFGFHTIMTARKGYGPDWSYREQTVALADDLNTFVAIYGETTQIQLDSAYSEGKIIFVKKDGLCRLLTSTSLYQPTPTAEGIRNYNFALYRPDIKQVETVFWLADGRGWTAATASADWQPKISASGILKGDGAGGVTAAETGTDYGTYSKPSTGIPKTDLASDVQTSLGKADTALQQHQSLAAYRTAADQDAIDAGKEAAGLGLTGASVGDLVRVNAVDATGKPTSWKKVALNEIKCNHNYLENWDFTNPVNQRGQQSYSTTGHCIDRWWRIFGVTTVVDGGISIAGVSSETYGPVFRQALSDPQKFAGKTVTISILVDEITGGYLGLGCSKSRGMNSGTVAVAITRQIMSPGILTTTATIPNDVGSNTYPLLVVNISVAKSATAKIRAVKFELGSEQTLCHNEGTEENPIWVLNEIPDYGEELRKCQRYYQLFRTESLRPTYGEDCRPVMATAQPTNSTLTKDGVTYYTLSSEP